MKKPARTLGRGLASLIPDDAFDATRDQSTDRSSLRSVPIEEVQPNPEQPREIFDNEELESLAASVREHGILSPLVVRRSEGRYILIAGERRLRAAGLAGLTEVPVVIRDAPRAENQLELALIENLQRSDLDPIEEARGFQRLVSEYAMTQDEVAHRVGKKRSTVANALRLLNLPDFALQALRENRISAGHARALLPLADEPQELRQALAKVIAQRLNVRATEQLVARLTRTPKEIRVAERDRRERTLDYATRLLTEALHTSVNIRPLKNGSGRIVIDYADAEDLERLIQHLRQDR